MKLALVGGFLGSGKTTSILRACQLLSSRGKRIAVITNDQGDQQVDGALVRSAGIAVREVGNGCFCCQFEKLDGHLNSLMETAQPDFVFAESVGSCTDLVATIAKPMGTLRPGLETTISVFADAGLLAPLIEGQASFLEESVRYIYKKQMEEADLLIINKADLLTAHMKARVDEVIRSEYAGKVILFQNSLDDDHVRKWLSAIEDFTTGRVRKSLELDYDVYGNGEARLAWLDRTMTLGAPGGDGLFIAGKIVSGIFDGIQAHHLTVGHLKFFLEADGWSGKVSFTTTSLGPDVRIPHDKANWVKVMINARVQTEPGRLEGLVDQVLSHAETAYGCRITTGKWSAFKPGYPRPTHRMA